MKDTAARKAFGKKVAKYRLDNGYSQEKLAEIVGVHRTYVSLIERGKQSVSLDNINRFAKALKVKPSDLVK